MSPRTEAAIKALKAEIDRLDLDSDERGRFLIRLQEFGSALIEDSTATAKAIFHEVLIGGPPIQ